MKECFLREVVVIAFGVLSKADIIRIHGLTCAWPLVLWEAGIHALLLLPLASCSARYAMLWRLLWVKYQDNVIRRRRRKSLLVGVQLLWKSKFILSIYRFTETFMFGAFLHWPMQPTLLTDPTCSSFSAIIDPPSFLHFFPMHTWNCSPGSSVFIPLASVPWYTTYRAQKKTKEIRKQIISLKNVHTSVCCVCMKERERVCRKATVVQLSQPSFPFLCYPNESISKCVLTYLLFLLFLLRLLRLVGHLQFPLLVFWRGGAARTRGGAWAWRAAAAWTGGAEPRFSQPFGEKGYFLEAFETWAWRRRIL